MSKCAVCGEKFKSIVSIGAKHIREHRCGRCHRLVGDGCFVKATNEKGEDILLCKTCDEDGSAEEATADSTIGNIERLGREFLDDASERVELAQRHVAERLDARLKDLGGEVRASASNVLDEAEKRLDALWASKVAELDSRGRKFADDVLASAEVRMTEMYRKSADDFEARTQKVVNEGITNAELRLGAWSKTAIDDLETRARALLDEGSKEARRGGRLLVVVAVAAAVSGVASLVVAWMQFRSLR